MKLLSAPSKVELSLKEAVSFFEGHRAEGLGPFIFICDSPFLWSLIRPMFMAFIEREQFSQDCIEVYWGNDEALAADSDSSANLGLFDSMSLTLMFEAEKCKAQDLKNICASQKRVGLLGAPKLLTKIKKIDSVLINLRPLRPYEYSEVLDFVELQEGRKIPLGTRRQILDQSSTLGEVCVKVREFFRASGQAENAVSLDGEGHQGWPKFLKRSFSQEDIIRYIGPDPKLDDLPRLIGACENALFKLSVGTSNFERMQMDRTMAFLTELETSLRAAPAATVQRLKSLYLQTTKASHGEA